MFHYVYILRSESEPTRHYVGRTEDLKARLQKHNEGGVPHTAKLRPWGVPSSPVGRASGP
ncbi:MAG TPA: GIY-YIG nuclease family protein [Verrucomicrobiota bacterium]|nr:GIY-YIG nuclease family protein [Verrucomicrobiota bacterium]